eukprot:620995-Pyramimonas_sp.AAC.2
MIKVSLVLGFCPRRVCFSPAGCAPPCRAPGAPPPTSPSDWPARQRAPSDSPPPPPPPPAA